MTGRGRKRWSRLVGLALGMWTAALAAQAPADEGRPDWSAITEGSLVFRSPISGRFELMPLERTAVEIDVKGLVAAATVTQRFTNRSDRPIEAVYVFPLPHDATVYDLEARVGERVIRSQIKEREEAQQIYAAARAEGRRAALVEQERPNVFTTSLANVLPGERIDVVLRFVQPLPWEDGRVRLTFPTVVGPRYIPGTRAVGRQGGGWAPDTDQVPDASRVTPPVLHPEAEARPDLTLRVQLEAGLPLSTVSSPSHAVRVVHEGSAARVELQSGAVRPDKDFVLEWQRAPEAGARTALFVSKDADASHFVLAAFPPTPELSGARAPLELLFVIDVSGSMSGTSIEQARRALLQGLERLGAGDRFNVVAFNHGVIPFHPEPLPATPDNLEAGRRFVSSLQANGGTEMLPALRLALSQQRAVEHLRYVVLLTDGCLGNEKQIFATLRSDLGAARLFTVAIGSAPNHHLAANMAHFGRGAFTSIVDGNEIEKQMARLLDQIESPALSDLALRFEGVEAADVYPERLPDLFLGQPLLVFGRLAGGESGRVVVEGRGAQGPFRQELPLDLRQAGFHPGVTRLWARARADALLEAWRSAGDESERAARRADAVAHALRYRLVTRFTSLVAVEEKPAHDQGTPERVDVATELPAGWQLEKVFGTNPATGTADDFLLALAAALLAAGSLLQLARIRLAA